jgi:7,8-dihydro-6-hydroxymethylpterin dimethyltransferase
MATTSPETQLIEAPVILAHTGSVCPVCLRRIPAARVRYGEEVYLEKTCPDHGAFRTIVWRGKPEYPSWERTKIPSHPEHPFTGIKEGCPYDCGLCANHRQVPCCVLLEVTQRCDLGCPVCFASAGRTQPADPDTETIRMWYERMLAAGGPFNIQLSGGEPCLRDDLPEIISLGKQMGYTYFQVNTNGLRLAEDLNYLIRLKEAGLNVVYLQFDGTTDAIYQTIRGRRILDKKIQTIRNCKDAHVGVVLVPTIVPGVNSENIGEIIRFAVTHHPAVRSVHFQPVSYFGRYPTLPTNSDRITIPEILQKMETQTGGLVHLDDFQPKGSENSYCSFHASFVLTHDGGLKPIKQRPSESGCCTPKVARDEVQRSREFVARNWTYAESEPDSTSSSEVSFGGWDAFLTRARTHLFSISGMAFQDAWNLDTDLLQDCCINVVNPEDGRLIPFCAYNLTDIHGRAIYRPMVNEVS